MWGRFTGWRRGNLLYAHWKRQFGGSTDGRRCIEQMRVSDSVSNSPL